jgi:hypothetical protein
VDVSVSAAAAAITATSSSDNSSTAETGISGAGFLRKAWREPKDHPTKKTISVMRRKKRVVNVKLSIHFWFVILRSAATKNPSLGKLSGRGFFASLRMTI